MGARAPRGQHPIGCREGRGGRSHRKAKTAGIERIAVLIELFVELLERVERGMKGVERLFERRSRGYKADLVAGMLAARENAQIRNNRRHKGEQR